MPKIKVCTKCKEAHWEDALCPKCNPVEPLNKEEWKTIEFALKKDIDSLDGDIEMAEDCGGDASALHSEMFKALKILEKVRKM